MTIHSGRERDNCNHCIYRKDVSRHFDLEDYCSLNMKHTSWIIIDDDCPLGKDILSKNKLEV